MASRRVIAWTPEMDALLGTIPDSQVAAMIGENEERARYRRIRLGIPSYRATVVASVMTECANCGDPIRRRRRDVKRSRRLYCGRTCADAGQKRRDSEVLRYGPGWRVTKAAIRARDKTCRACGKTPKANGHALHVHHLKPFRLGGTNHPTNLVALCDPCHHVAEAATSAACDLIPLGVSLDGSCLTITLGSKELWRGSVAGADSRHANGSIPSRH